MKKIAILIFMALALLGAQQKLNVDDIIKTVDKDSPQYSLDILYAKKIKTLQFEKEKFDISSIKDSRSYVEAFKKLTDYLKILSNSDKNIEDLNKKIELLSSFSTSTQKLEYLYYQKLIEIEKERKEYIQANIKNWEKALYEKLFDIKFDINRYNKNIKLYKQKLSQTEKQIEQLKIDLEKWKIADDKERISTVNKKINYALSKRDEIYQNLADNYLLIFFQQIKDKNKEAFKTEKQIEKYLTKDQDRYKYLLNYFEKMRFGSTQLLLNKTTDEIELTIQKTWNILNYPLFSVENKNISLINFFIFLLFIILGSIVGKYYKKSIYSLKKRRDISNSTITLLTNLGYYLILLIAVLLALKSIGLDLSSFTMIAGALSVGIGFGLQNIVSNFVSGIILMFEKSIKIGDYIQIDAETRGTVVDIKMRSITIRTNDNIDLIVPNQNFIQNIVTNWTLSDNSRRFRIPFGVSYGTKVEDVEKVVLQALKNSKFPHYKIGDKKPLVTFTSMGDSSINFELFVWVKGELTLRPRYTTSEILKIIYKALNDANINIPFPQQDIYIKELPPIKSEQSCKEKET